MIAKFKHKKLEVIYRLAFIAMWTLPIVSASASDAYQSAHVRSWTDWYNTDNPQNSDGDDETLVSIRQRGRNVCGGSVPVDALCRDAENQGLRFTSETTRVTNDRFVMACTTDGLLCRNSDQVNNTKCRDYEIQFECLGVNPEAPPPNLEVIGVAAGLSVIVPILCVAIMHVARKCRDRRAAHTDSLIPENSEQSVQTDDLPPSYSFLFPDCPSLNTGDSSEVPNNGNSGSNDANNSNNSNTTHQSVMVSLVAPTGDRRLRLSSGSLASLSEYNDDALNNINTTRQLERQQSQTSFNNTSSTSSVTSAWRSRFPINMHLSVFDLFRSSDRASYNHSSPSSPDFSYIQTPPPTYKEAIVIIGCDPSQLEKLKAKENC